MAGTATSDFARKEALRRRRIRTTESNKGIETQERLQLFKTPQHPSELDSKIAFLSKSPPDLLY
jgi:hypothetical protein